MVIMSPKNRRGGKCISSLHHTDRSVINVFFVCVCVCVCVCVYCNDFFFNVYFQPRSVKQNIWLAFMKIVYFLGVDRL